MDERQWLLATAYNTGIECLQFVVGPYLAAPTYLFRFDVFSSASVLDEAKRWFEASTVICRFVPGGKQRAEKVRIVCLVHLLLRVPFRSCAHVHLTLFLTQDLGNLLSTPRSVCS